MVTETPIQQRPSRDASVALLQSAGLPASDLTDEHLEHFFYCGPAQAPTALIGLELCGSNALLRSLVVASNERTRGLGSAMLQRAETYARSRGARSIYLLTTTAEAFFSHRGYRATSRESAPLAIQRTREFADICPASSAFMVKRF
jgi:N-acetylglutamate synthase-like GNAT family acetyltransferase